MAKYTIFTHAETPGFGGPYNPFETAGNTYYGTAAGWITGVWVYVHASQTTMRIRIWRWTSATAGTQLTTGTGIDVSRAGGTLTTGWCYIPLPTPIAVAANVAFCVSYYGNYQAETAGFFSTAKSSGPLRAITPNQTVGGIASLRQGTYAEADAIPTGNTGGNSYWIEPEWSDTDPSGGGATIEIDGSLSASASISAAIERVADTGATLTTAAQLTTAIDRTAEIGAALDAASSLSVGIDRIAYVAAALGLDASLSASLDAETVRAIDAALAGDASLLASLLLVADAGGPLTASSGLSADVDRISEIGAALAAAATLASGVDRIGFIAASLGLSASMSASLDAEAVHAIEAALAGDASLLAELLRVADSGGILGLTGSLSADVGRIAPIDASPIAFAVLWCVLDRVEESAEVPALTGLRLEVGRATTGLRVSPSRTSLEVDSRPTGLRIG